LRVASTRHAYRRRSGSSHPGPPATAWPSASSSFAWSMRVPARSTRGSTDFRAARWRGGGRVPV